LIVVGAVLAVAAIVGTALYIVTKDDDVDQVTTDTQPTAETATETTLVPPAASIAAEPTTTVAPVTTVPPTTVAPTATIDDGVTTTTGAPVPSIPAIPEGSADLGNGVGLPIPTGFTQTSQPGSMIALSDNTSVIVAHSAVRTPGIDPALVTQEYVNAFDNSFQTISYGPTAKNGSLTGEPQADVYTTFFLTFDDTTGAVQSGFINVYVRGDGLVLILSAYGPNGYAGVIPQANVDAMNLSFQRTPPIGPSTPLATIAPFRVATIHSSIPVDGLVAFTATPGFVPYGPTGEGRALVSNGVEDVQVDRMSGQADTNVVTASAQAVIAQNYTGVEYSELSLGDPDPWGVVHGAFSWTGVFVGGQRSVGRVDFYFDPATANAYVAFRTWFTGADDSDPYPAASQFMLRSLFNSFTGIP